MLNTPVEFCHAMVDGRPAAGPLLVVLSGPSGVGKDAIREELLRRGHRFHFAVTATTRPPRGDERDGIDYRFLDEATFRGLIETNGLLEHEQYGGGFYGVPRAEVADALAAGADVVVRVDVRGADSIKRFVPEAVLIFVYPPDIETLARRLAGRASEDAEARALRLDLARAELARIGEFDYAVLNADGGLETATDQVEAIMLAERCRVGRRPAKL